jgi:hypothetical protein
MAIPWQPTKDFRSVVKVFTGSKIIPWSAQCQKSMLLSRDLPEYQM